jgi:hypothetical protein
MSSAIDLKGANVETASSDGFCTTVATGANAVIGS